MPDFKYQTEIDELISNGCKLPSLSVPHNKFACRYVFDHEHPNNHKPGYIQNPKRVISDADNNRLRISYYALSCFEVEELAVQQFEDLKNTHKNIGDSIGNALCSGFLEEEDGLITDSNKKTTHFDLYEYCECDLGNKFEIKQRLI